MSPDPIGPEDSLNLYLFVGNNPVNLVDPNGLSTELFHMRGVSIQPITYEEAQQHGVPSRDVGWFGVYVPAEAPEASSAEDVVRLSREYQVPVLWYEPRYWEMISEGQSQEQALRELGFEADEEVVQEQAVSRTETELAEESHSREAEAVETEEGPESGHENEPRNPTGAPADSSDMPDEGNPQVHSADGSSRTTESKERQEAAGQTTGNAVAGAMSRLHSDISSIVSFPHRLPGLAIKHGAPWFSENVAEPILGETIGPPAVTFYQGIAEALSETLIGLCQTITEYTNPLSRINPLDILAAPARQAKVATAIETGDIGGVLSTQFPQASESVSRFFSSASQGYQSAARGQHLQTVRHALMAFGELPPGRLFQSLPTSQLALEAAEAFEAGARGDVDEAARRAGRATERLVESVLMITGVIKSGGVQAQGGGGFRVIRVGRNDPLRRLATAERRAIIEASQRANQRWLEAFRNRINNPEAFARLEARWAELGGPPSIGYFQNFGVAEYVQVINGRVHRGIMTRISRGPNAHSEFQMVREFNLMALAENQVLGMFTYNYPCRSCLTNLASGYRNLTVRTARSIYNSGRTGSWRPPVPLDDWIQ